MRALARKTQKQIRKDPKYDRVREFCVLMLCTENWQKERGYSSRKGCIEVEEE